MALGHLSKSGYLPQAARHFVAEWGKMCYIGVCVGHTPTPTGGDPLVLLQELTPAQRAALSKAIQVSRDVSDAGLAEIAARTVNSIISGKIGGEFGQHILARLAIEAARRNKNPHRRIQ